MVRGDRPGQGARYAAATRSSASTSSAAAARPPGRAPDRPIFLRSAATTRPRSCDGSSSICSSAPLAAIVGASYGGMVALAFAERYPQLVERMRWRSAPRIARIRWRRRGAACSARWCATQRKNGDGAGRIAARARAGDGDVSQPRRVRSALQRCTGARSTDASSSRSSPICSRAAMPMRPPTCRKRSCACPSPSTCTQVDAARIRVPVTLVADPRRSARADLPICGRCRARLGGAGVAGRALVAVRPRRVPEGSRMRCSRCSRARCERQGDAP